MHYHEPWGTPRVGMLTVRMRIPACHSLKEKRSRLRRLMEKLRREVNISISEVGDQDVASSTVFCCVTVASDWAQAERRLQKARGMCTGCRGMTLVDSRTERLI